MRTIGTWGLALGTVLLAPAQDLEFQSRQLELKGDVAAARAVLEESVKAGSPGALAAYADFLDRRSDPQTRAIYGKLLEEVATSGNRQAASSVARRLVVLDMLADDQTSAIRHLEQYRSLGGADFPSPPAATRSSAAVELRGRIEIPGPMRSFARMAALSPDLAPQDLLPALARNVVTNGYQASTSAEALEMTEYLKLVVRYLSQARELEKLSGSERVLKIETCESSLTNDLLRVLGYRMRGGCGAEVVLETVNATRAFLTIDSGFPLAELEQALRTNRPFIYDFKPTQVPVLYEPEYWLSARERTSGDFINAFISDPSLCRLYLGMAKLDRETADELKKAMPVQRIRAFAHVLDFFGGMFQLDGGKIVTPGGDRSRQAWADLVGVSPDQGVAFAERLIGKDDGWLASYFDSLARIHGPLQDYLTEPSRMKRFYAALRGRITSPGPARPVFRSNTDLMLLTTRLIVGADGRPRIPGGLTPWKNLFVVSPHGKYDGKLTRLANSWKEPDDLIEALFALCRKAVENEPLKIFMSLSDIDRRRAQPLDAATVEKLIRGYRRFGAQYIIFSEFPALSDATISGYLDSMAFVSGIRDQGLRSNAAGIFQGLVGLWQIFSRQGSIPTAAVEDSFKRITEPVGRLKASRELFDFGMAGVEVLLRATNSPQGVSVQDRFLDLLAGAANPEDQESHNLLVQDMIRVFEAQRLFSLQNVVDIAVQIERIQKGEKPDAALVNRLATRLSEISLPKNPLSGAEKNTFAFGYWTDRHIEAQRKGNLRAAVDRAAGDPEKLKDVRGSLAIYLRDTLVGLNYIHYTPPGAQVLLTNPLFVRSHDFIGLQGSNQTWRPTEVFGSGWPTNAGGRLVGSLISLPYALAEAEQNFLIPTREQALIWGDLVPQMIVSAKVHRWWNVTPSQIHWVGLHLRLADSILAEAALNPALRKQAVSILSLQAPPSRARMVNQLVAEGKVKRALEYVTPSESFVLASRMVQDKQAPACALTAEIQRLASAYPERISSAAISRAFGTPKPTLTHSYEPELLHLRTFPTLMGYSSRIMAESWESNLLYYAALADEVYLRPSQLNVVVPQWTQRTVEGIFATHLEDWPALLRSLRVVGDDVRSKLRSPQAATAGE
jgi:hypothetical protein